MLSYGEVSENPRDSRLQFSSLLPNLKMVRSHFNEFTAALPLPGSGGSAPGRGRGTAGQLPGWRLLVAAAITILQRVAHAPTSLWLRWGGRHRDSRGGGGTLAVDWSRAGPRVLSESQGGPGRGLLESRIQPPHGSPVPT